MTDDGVAGVASEHAREWLLAFRRDADPTPHRERLASLDSAAFDALRRTRTVALAFWINCYNAGTQHLLATAPDRYDSPLRWLRFFRVPAVTVAGRRLSLDRIEHGILRGSRSKYGLGYLPRAFVTATELRHRLRSTDPRIHFALNCGAVSCPAIRAYDPDTIDDQLDRATAAYLRGVEYEPDADRVTLPRLFRWYRGDFGGPDGIRAILRDHDVVPADADPDLAYDAWDWTMQRDAFID